MQMSVNGESQGYYSKLGMQYLKEATCIIIIMACVHVLHV